MANRLTLVGVSVRSAAQAARRAGFSPFSIDLFGDLDTRAAGSAVCVDRFPDGFLAALRESPQAPWLYTGGLENHPHLVEQLARERPLLGNGGATLRDVRDPGHLSRALLEAGHRYPAVVHGSSRAERIRKPLQSGGGRGVRLVAADEDRRSDGRWYEQQFVEGQAASALFLARSGSCQLLGTSRQLIGRDFGLPEAFAYVGSIAPLSIAPAISAELGRIGATLASRFKLIGLFGVDLILRGDEVWVLEVNPRFTASVEVIERATGLNAVALHVASCTGTADLPDLLPPAAQPWTSHGKAIVYARSSGVAGARLKRLVDGWNESGRQIAADLPHHGSRFSAGEPILTVFAHVDSERDSDECLVDQLRERGNRVLAALDPD